MNGLSRHRHALTQAKSAPGLRLTPELVLKIGRAHEICGPARRSMAVWAASVTDGPILWLRPDWRPEHLNPDGLLGWLRPERLITASAGRRADILWSAEEALRSGAVSLVVCDCPEPPGLTPVRRLHLAAEHSGSVATALLLTPGDGGAAGIETRWHARPCHERGKTAWHVERRRARMERPAAWRVQIDPAPARAPGTHLRLVSKIAMLETERILQKPGSSV